MYSVAFFVATLEGMTDPYLRAVTRHLLADEVLHGRFGIFYLEAWADWLARRPEERGRISTYLRYVFAVCEREFVREADEHVHLEPRRESVRGPSGAEQSGLDMDRLFGALGRVRDDADL